MNERAHLLEAIFDFRCSSTPLLEMTRGQGSRLKWELWSRLSTSTIVLVLLHARAPRFAGGRSVVRARGGTNIALPARVASFDGPRRAIPIIAEVFVCMLYYQECL